MQNKQGQMHKRMVALEWAGRIVQKKLEECLKCGDRTKCWQKEEIIAVHKIIFLAGKIIDDFARLSNEKKEEMNKLFQ